MRKNPPPRPKTKSVKIEVDAIEKLKTWCEANGKRLTWELSRAAERAAEREGV